MAERVIGACDGAAKGNPGPAGWAFVVADADGVPQRWRSGALGRSTNNVGELTALEQLLLATDPAAPLEVRLDSTYTRDAVTKWLPGWKRNGWRTAAGTPVANRELIQHIDELLQGRDVAFVYVRAHQVDGDRLNAIADKAASDAARTQQDAAGTADELPVPEPVKRAAAPRRKAPAAAGRTGASPTAAAAGGSPARTGRPTVTARYPGRCACSRPYAKGDTIAKVGAGWGHPECAETTG